MDRDHRLAELRDEIETSRDRGEGGEADRIEAHRIEQDQIDSETEPDAPWWDRGWR